MTLTLIDVSQINQFSETFIGMGRNRAINGEMMIDQVNAGAAVTQNAATNKYSVDMWQGQSESADGVFTMTRSTSTPPTGFSHFLRAQTTTADASVSAAQSYFMLTFLEGYMVRDFLLGTANAKAFTLSFWARSSQTATYSGSFVNGNLNRSYPFTYVINAINTWEFKTITLTGDITGTWNSSTGAGIYIYMDIGSGSSNLGTADAWAANTYLGATGATKLISTLNATLDITGFQLELGSTATEFEYRPFAFELMLCQRYFEKSYEVDTAVATNIDTGVYGSVVSNTGNATSGRFLFKVPKRSSPTVILYAIDGSSGNANWQASGGAGTEAAGTVYRAEPNGFIVYSSTLTYVYVSGHYTADARF